MKDQGKGKPRLQKKPYSKPEVKQVPLRPEEAVLGGCKILGGGTGPGGKADCGYPVYCPTGAS